MRERIHGADEIGLLLRALEQCPRSHAQRERAVSLAVRNLGPHQAGAVLCRRDFHAAAGIQNGDDKRLQFLLDAFGKRSVEDLAGDVEGEFSHGWFPLWQGMGLSLFLRVEVHCRHARDVRDERSLVSLI